MNPAEKADKVEEFLKELLYFFKSLDHLPEMNSIDEIMGVGSHLVLGAYCRWGNKKYRWAYEC